MIFKVILQTLKNFIKITEVFTMMNYTNPDAPVSGGNWLANTYAPYQQTPVYSVGYAPQNPFANINDASRRTMVSNPALAYGQLQPPVQNGTTQTVMQPFSSYPPSTPATSSLNQLAVTHASGNTAAMTQNNPWATPATTPNFVAPMAAPQTAAPVPSLGYGSAIAPTLTYDFASTAWDKKNGSPWPQPTEFTMNTPMVNWNQYSATPSVNGYYAPTTANTLQPQYPTNYNTTPISSDWTAICETNFKQQY